MTDKWPANTKYGDDVDAFRNAALKAIDTDPDLNKFADVGRVINKNMTVLRDQFQAASEGTAYEGMVQDCKLRAREMSEALKNIKGEDVIACKQKVDELRASLDFIKDDQAKHEVFKKIQSMEDLLKLADPSSPDRKALDKMLGDVLSRDFSAATAANWLKQNGPVIAASIIAGAITVASMGTASPLAVLLVSSAVALGAAQATKEVLFLVNHHIGDTGLGVYNERSLPGAWASKTYDRTAAFFSSIDNRSAQQNIEEFAKLIGSSEKDFLNEVLAPLGKEYGMNVLMGLGCIGLGQLGAQGLKGLSPSSFSKFLVSRQSMQFAQTIEQATAEASRSRVSKEFLKDWMGALKTELKQNTKDTILDETRSAAIDEALGKYVGKGNSWISFGISGAAALRNGRRSRSALELGDNGSVRVARDFEHEYIGQLKRDGHTVRDLGHGQYDVLPYNALKGEAPVRVLAAARGDGQPPRDLTADGNPMFRRHVGELPAEISLGDVNWKQGQYAKSAMHDVGLMTDHFVKGNYEDAVIAAKETSKTVNLTEKPVTFDLDAFHNGSTNSFDSFLKKMSAQGHAPDANSMSIPKPIVRVNGIDVDMITGKSTAGNSINDSARIAAAEQEVAKFKNSASGQRILAERALIAIEEGIHVRQAQGGEILSSSYAQFIAETKSGADANAAMDPTKRSKESLEQEVLFALHDKGWTLDQIKHHYGPHHQEARAAAFKWLENHERSSNIAKNQKALDYINNQSSKVESAFSNPALKEQSYKSLDHLSSLLKDGRINQDIAMDIVDLMKDTAKTGRIVSPHAIDALASLPKISGAELIDFTKPQQAVLVDMLNSRALSKAKLTDLLQNTEGTQLRTALDLMKTQHQNGTKNNRSIDQALDLAANKSSANETIAKLFHDKNISTAAYDALAKIISGKATGNAELDAIFTPERLKAAIDSGAKLTFNSQLNDLGSVLSDYLATGTNNLKRSPEQIAKLLDMPPGSSFQTAALLRSNLSEAQLGTIFADVQSLNSVTDRHAKLSQHNALLQNPELHSAICKIADKNLRNDLIGAGANSYLKKEQIASIERAFQSSPEAAAALHQVFSSVPPGQDSVKIINQITDTNLTATEYNQLKASMDKGIVNIDNLNMLLKTSESTRNLALDVASSGKVQTSKSLGDIINDQNSHSVLKALKSGAIDEQFINKLWDMDNPDGPSSAHAQSLRTMLNAQADGALNLDQAAFKKHIGNSQTAFYEQMKLDNKYQVGDPSVVAAQKQALQLTKQLDAKLNAESRSLIDTYLQETIPQRFKIDKDTNLPDSTLHRLETANLNYVLENSANLSPAQLHEKLERAIGGGALMMAAERAGINKHIPPENMEIFVFGTSSKKAAEFLSQQGAALSASGGNFGGKFYTTGKTSTAEFFGRRAAGKENDTHQVVAMALPKDLVESLKRSESMKEKQLTTTHETDMLEFIFDSNSIKKLQEHARFFPIDEPPSANAKMEAADTAPNTKKSHPEANAAVSETNVPRKNFADNTTRARESNDTVAAPVAIEAKTPAPKIGVQEIDLDTLKPTNETAALWLENAVKKLELDSTERAAFDSALKNGDLNFTVFDRKALEALELEQRIKSFEQGKEVNSDPYVSGTERKVPLQHADLYDPGKWPAATLMVKVVGKDGQPEYHVVNGCRRVHVFGSETLNPNNKSIPAIVFNSPEAMELVLGYSPARSIAGATPFNFESKK